MRKPSHEAQAPSPTPATGTHQSHAWLWAPMPRARARLREAGAPHGTTAPGAWQAHHRAWATSPRTPSAGDSAERLHAPAFRPCVQRGDEQSCPHPQTIHPLTQGKKLCHAKLVNAYDLTIAPIIKGKSNCPAQFGRKPGIVSEPATGFIFATLVPQGNPSDPSYGLPLLDKVQNAIDRVRIGPKRQIHSVASDLGLNDPFLRHALHERGILTVGIPKTVEPVAPNPSAQAVHTILTEAGLNRRRTPHQVHLACASGYSRPVVESHIASLLARGAGQVRYKGLQGAVVQQGMTVMTHNGATLVRIRRQRLSKRAQKFRRLLGLRPHNINQINNQKN